MITFNKFITTYITTVAEYISEKGMSLNSTEKQNEKGKKISSKIKIFAEIR